MAREQVMAVRNNANQLTADDLGLSSSIKIAWIALFCHLNPRLCTGTTAFSEDTSIELQLKYCWAKESAVVLRQTDCSRAPAFRLDRGLKPG